MDGVVEILAALMIWRFLLSVGVSALFAFVLSQAFAPFTAGYCVSLVLLGVAFGAIWHSRAVAGIGLSAAVPPVSISKAVAFPGFALIGFFWGNLASWFFDSQLLGGVALVSSVAIVGIWYRFILRRPASVGYLVFASVALLAGFALFLFGMSLNA